MARPTRFSYKPGAWERTHERYGTTRLGIEHNKTISTCVRLELWRRITVRTMVWGEARPATATNKQTADEMTDEMTVCNRQLCAYATVSCGGGGGGAQRRRVAARREWGDGVNTRCTFWEASGTDGRLTLRLHITCTVYLAIRMWRATESSGPAQAHKQQWTLRQQWTKRAHVQSEQNKCVVVFYA